MIALCRAILHVLPKQFGGAILIAKRNSHEWKANHSRATRQRTHLQRLAAGSGAADVDEQSRPRGRRESRSTGRLRRNRSGREKLGSVRRNRLLAMRTRERRNAAGPIGKAGWEIPDAR